MCPQYYLSHNEERARYLTHNNNVNDPDYQTFVQPVIQAVTNYTQTHHKGLDYGAGTGPVITMLLREKGYFMTTYDPFFIPNRKALSATYDFIVCCEVVEHFHNPQSEFDRFRQLLNPGGLLVIKTEFLTHNIDFPSWYYINDPTHTIFYSPEGICQLLAKHEFQCINNSPRLVIAKKN